MLRNKSPLNVEICVDDIRLKFTQNMVPERETKRKWSKSVLAKKFPLKIKTYFDEVRLNFSLKMVNKSTMKPK